MSSAILRTAARRSLALPSFFSAGSSSTFSTRSIWVLSWSLGTPAAATGVATAPKTNASRSTGATRRCSDLIDDLLDLSENVLRQELFEVHRRLDLADPPV